MPRRFCLVLLTTIPLLLVTENLSASQPLALMAQNSGAYGSNHPGGYLAWIKLLCIIVVFFLWVKSADWLNRDAMKIGELTGLPATIWNPINVGVFFIGLMATLFIPIFGVGYTMFVLCAITPFLVYYFIRRSKVKASPRILEFLKLKPGEAPPPEVLPQDEGAEVDFSPAGADKNEKQVNLIRARQSSGFPALKDMIDEALFKRADLIMLDYTREKTDRRIQVDGAWHAFPPMDRVEGDALLVSAKALAGLNVTERRAKQEGAFGLKTEKEKAEIELVTQGVKTGERVTLKINRKSKGMLTLNQLGMFPKMLKKFKACANDKGLVIISAPPMTGLTTSWQGALVTADRLTRDCVALLDHGELDTSKVENYVLHYYDSKKGERQVDIGKGMLLTQPDAVALPVIEDSDAMDLFAAQVVLQNRSVVTKTPAKSAAEALLKMYAKAGDRAQFIEAAKAVTCQRLLRRLCDECKQEVRVPPKMIQQLGGKPKEQQTLFNQFKLPPPDQRVDERGKEIEYPPCEVCGGLGYIGRIAVFEFLEVNGEVKEAMKTTPKPAAIEQAAGKTGKLPLVNEAYKLVLLGITSLAEVQRVFKAK